MLLTTYTLHPRVALTRSLTLTLTLTRTLNWTRTLTRTLTLAGSLCSAVESVYQFRARGQVRYGYAERMHNLFNAFSTLSGTLFDPNCSDPSDSSTEVLAPCI